MTSGLLIKSFAQLQDIDPGFRTRGLLSVDLSLPGAKYQQPAQRLAFYQRLIREVKALPGVESVGASSAVLLPELANSADLTIEGRPNPPPEQRLEVPIDRITVGFFTTMGISLLEGRDFAESDSGEAAPVAIINQSMARRFWPDGSPIGKRFKYGEESSRGPWRTVVGVVGDARRTALEKEARPSTYLPYYQGPRGAMTLVAKTSTDPLELAGPIRSRIWAIDPDQPISRMAGIGELLSSRVSQRRFNMVLLTLFAGLALFLSVIGLYGVISYWVNQSRRELGVRAALGAQAGDLVKLVVGRGLKLAVAGVVLGVIGATITANLISGLLFEVSPIDPTVYLSLALLLIAVAFCASYLPARRAVRIDPTEALRYE